MVGLNARVERVLGSLVATVTGGQGMTQSEGWQYAYDYTNGRMATINYRESQGQMIKYQDIYLYSKGVAYIVEIGPGFTICQQISINGTLPHCIPSSATYLGSSYYGDHKLNVDFFKFFESMSSSTYANITMTVSQGDCIPFSVVEEGMFDGVPKLRIRGYVNYTSGISDPSKYFTVPSGCPPSNRETLNMRKSPFDKILP
ncbi:uncharacterized protein LOC119730982 isoform X2 [Patiria miniata]|uniref:Uncharacterized protein n=1 Tax=Patiria miniata TaxID=46514 RepID=A0A914A979_PATMI|nr:uncharacterized protein LOC119730982 isoform X2 [Patiria miniata]